MSTRNTNGLIIPSSFDCASWNTRTRINAKWVFSQAHPHQFINIFSRLWASSHSTEPHSKSNRSRPTDSLPCTVAFCRVLLLAVWECSWWVGEEQRNSRKANTLTFLAVVCYQKCNASSVAENFRYTDCSLSLKFIQMLIKNTLANKSLTRENTQNEVTWSANRYKVNKVPFLKVWKRLTIN